MARFIPKQIYVLRTKIEDYFVYAADPKDLQPNHTDNIVEATQFDERDIGRFKTLIKFRKAITGLEFEVFQIK